MKVLCVIVLFNRSLENSVSFQTLVKGTLSDEIQLYIHDNSPKPMHSENDFQDNSFIYYISDTTNSGVSTGYNRASVFAARNGFTHLLLLDQDSTFDNCDYIQECIDKANQMPYIKLFVPQVITISGCPISPTRLIFKIPTVFSFQSDREYPIKSMGIINSGMFVDVSALKNVGGYNEKVFLDYSDYQFIDKLSRYYHTFYIVNRKLIQDFSDEETDSNKLFQRFKLFCKSLNGYEANCLIDSLAIKFIILKRTLSLSVRCKSMDFLRYYFFSKS